jgi:1,4-dihydroxy-2-naphthoate octaprenyltransferase
MSTPGINWPLARPPSEGARIIVASQGPRLWTVECHLEAFGEAFRLTGADRTTLQNLIRQHRVAFTIVDDGPAIQGSGMARTAGPNSDLILEPYRLADGESTFELKLNGWAQITDAPAPDISRYAFWYQAFRLVTVPLSALPVLVGGAAAFALGHFNILGLALALIGTVAAHAGANAVADYFDFKNGVDLSKALSSHLGALAQERVEPELILIAAFACFLITAVVGLVLVQTVGWGLLWFGLSGLVGAFFYTGRPISYKYRSLGELMLGILCGPVIVMGAYYVGTRGWDWGVFLMAAALGMIISSISLANNLRDLPDDGAAGIRTLPMSLGVRGAKRLYYLLTWGPYAVMAASLAFHPGFWPVVVVLLSLPKAAAAAQALRATSDDINDIRQKATTNPYPLNSIRLHARFGELAVVGLVIAGVIRLVAGG